MLTEHMDAVLATTCFQSAQLSKLHHAPQQQDEYTTYIVQYHFNEMAHYERYQKQFAPALQADHQSHFGAACLSFRTVLEIIEHKKSR